MFETVDRVVTRFGVFAASDRDVVTLPDGLPGFENCRRFVLVSAGELDPFTCLQGLDDPRPSFLALDPRLAVDGYDTELASPERQRLAAGADEPMLWLALVRLDGEPPRVNLRAPVVINPRRMIGFQRIAADSAYTLDHPLYVV